MQRLAFRLTVVSFVIIVCAGLCADAQEERRTPELFRVRQDGKIGFINRAGKVVIRTDATVGANFSEGLARVQLNKKWGYVDEGGKLTIQPQFDDAFDFTGGLALVKVGDKYGYIDKAGKYIWRPTK